MAANQACCALIPAPDAHSFVYLKTSQSVSEYEGQATGSAQQNLNQTIVANLQTIIPVRNILTAFQGIVAGHLFTMIQNTKESDSLASMRDYLLPKLISGDIRIRDAEKFVEAA
jgi:type I restriction enzyme S subunit